MTDTFKCWCILQFLAKKKKNEKCVENELWYRVKERLLICSMLNKAKGILILMMSEIKMSPHWQNCAGDTAKPPTKLTSLQAEVFALWLTFNVDFLYWVRLSKVLKKKQKKQRWDSFSQISKMWHFSWEVLCHSTCLQLWFDNETIRL